MSDEANRSEDERERARLEREQRRLEREAKSKGKSRGRGKGKASEQPVVPAPPPVVPSVTEPEPELIASPPEPVTPLPGSVATTKQVPKRPRKARSGRLKEARARRGKGVEGASARPQRSWRGWVIGSLIALALIGLIALIYVLVVDSNPPPPPPPALAPSEPITIAEGRTREETAKNLKGSGIIGSYLKATKSSRVLNPRTYGAPRGTPSLEGFLFPDTYEMPKRFRAARLANSQLATFKRKFKSVSMKYAKSKNLSKYDVLIIASMIEREAQLAEERPLISAVIYNRLKAGTPLGIDATIRYYEDNWTQPLKQSELDRESPYNTRINQGLPPTPIGSPGIASIRAAARPKKVDYLFYVVKPNTCGKHSFSSTEEQFNKDVQKYDEERAKRGGKSPTTC